MLEAILGQGNEIEIDIWQSGVRLFDISDMAKQMILKVTAD